MPLTAVSAPRFFALAEYAARFTAPLKCIDEEVHTTRARGRRIGFTKCARRKCERWFTWYMSSIPSSDTDPAFIVAAFRIMASTSTPSSIRPRAKARTEAKLARSSVRCSIAPLPCTPSIPAALRVISRFAITTRQRHAAQGSGRPRGRFRLTSPSLRSYAEACRSAAPTPQCAPSSSGAPAPRQWLSR